MTKRMVHIMNTSQTLLLPITEVNGWKRWIVPNTLEGVGRDSYWVDLWAST
jgi:hypothetical protein